MPPFSLADPAVTTDILTQAGFASVEFARSSAGSLSSAVPNIDAAHEAVAGLFMEQGDSRSPEKEGVSQRVRALLGSHLTPDGVLFDSRAWIVTAHKPQQRA
ncbi:hypothetical protein OKA06_20220 [Novosphingobium sp. MW5]|nr:hypothetical protein [Novosphingobium sp. MW5]